MLSIISQIVIIINALSISLSVSLLSLFTTHKETYSDLIIGHIAWNFDSKMQDLLFAPIFAVTFCFSYLILELSYKLSFKIFGEIYSSRLILISLYSFIPILLVVGSYISLILFSTNNFSILDLRALTNIVVLPVILITLVFIFSCISKKKLDTNILHYSIFILYTCLLLPFLISQILSRFSPKIHVLYVEKINYETVVYSLILLIMLILASLLFSNKNILSRFYTLLICFAEILISLSYFIIKPGYFLINQLDNIYQYPLSFTLVAICIIPCLISLTSIQGVISNKSSKRPSILLFFTIIFSVRSQATPPPLLPTDDYHFGEKLLGFWSYINSYRPYVNYVPPHGILSDDIFAFASSLIYNDLNVQNILVSTYIVYYLFMLSSYLLVYFLFRNIPISISVTFCLYFLLSKPEYFIFSLMIMTFLSRRFISNYKLWICTYLCVLPPIFLLMPAQTILCMLPLLIFILPLQILRFISDFKEKRTIINQKYTVITLTTMFIYSLLLLLLPWLKYSFLSALKYVLENAKINQLAYGVSWTRFWDISAISLEMIRMSWIVILAIVLTLFSQLFLKILLKMLVKNFSLKKYEDLLFTESMLIYISIITILVLMIPYSMGRIDPSSLSRPGIASAIACCPILLIMVERVYLINSISTSSLAFIKKYSDFLVFILCGFFAIFGSILAPVNFSILVNYSNSVLSTNLVSDTLQSNLPNIGQLGLSDDRFLELKTIKDFLDSHLKSDDKYLDLTNRNANYFYFDRLPPIPITAPYNLVSVDQEKSAIEILRTNTPKVILLGKPDFNINHDGGGLSLRNPMLYRFILKEYKFIQYKGFVFGLQNDFFENLFDTQLYYGELEIFNSSSEEDIITNDALLVEKIDWGSSNTKKSYFLLDYNDRECKVDFQNKSSMNYDVLICQEKDLDSFSNLLNQKSHPSFIKIKIGKDMFKIYQNYLLSKVLKINDLGQIPSSWGHSFEKLKGRVSYSNPFELTNIERYNDVRFNENSITIAGKDPYIVINVKSLHWTGFKANLFKMRYKCISPEPNLTQTSRIQLFWTSDLSPSESETNSINLTANNGDLLVPLDAHPNWIMSKEISTIRIDFDPELCDSVILDNSEMYTRNF